MTFHQNRHINEQDSYSVFLLGFDDRILYTLDQHTSGMHHQWPFHFFFHWSPDGIFDAHPCHTVPCMPLFVMNRFHIFIITVTWKVNLLNKGILFFCFDFWLILTIQCTLTRLYYRECSTKMLSCIVMCARDIRSKTLWPRQNGGNYTDDTFKLIWLNGKYILLILISLNFDPRGPIDNKSTDNRFALNGNKPFSKFTPNHKAIEKSSLDHMGDIEQARPIWSDHNQYQMFGIRIFNPYGSKQIVVHLIESCFSSVKSESAICHINV